jgi:hypothetical protein
MHVGPPYPPPPPPRHSQQSATDNESGAPDPPALPCSCLQLLALRRAGRTGKHPAHGAAGSTSYHPMGGVELVPTLPIRAPVLRTPKASLGRLVACHLCFAQRRHHVLLMRTHALTGAREPRARRLNMRGHRHNAFRRRAEVSDTRETPSWHARSCLSPRSPG